MPAALPAEVEPAPQVLAIDDGSAFDLTAGALVAAVLPRGGLSPKELWHIRHYDEWEAQRFRVLVAPPCEPEAEAEQHEIAEPEQAMELGPPIDLVRRDRYYALLGAAKKAQRQGQRKKAYKLTCDARMLEELRLVEPTARPPDAAAPPPPSQAQGPGMSRRATRACQAQPVRVEQQVLWEEADAALDVSGEACATREGVGGYGASFLEKSGGHGKLRSRASG